jgi:hypothetical protein
MIALSAHREGSRAMAAAVVERDDPSAHLRFGENPDSAFRPIESKTDRRFRHARHSRPRTLDRNPFRMIGTGALRVMIMLMAFFDHLRR